MKIKVYLDSDPRVTGAVEVENGQFEVLPNGWIKAPVADWLRFKNGKMRIKKGAYLSFDEFKKLSYQNLVFPDCGSIDFETTDDVEIEFEDLKFEFWLEDATEHPYHGEIEISPGTIICLPVDEYRKKFTCNGYLPQLDDHDFFCFTTV